jgi:hypothetical protein
MAFLTTNPSPYLINIPELQNVQTSASGSSATLTNSVSDLLNYLDTVNGSLSIATIGSSSNGSAITMRNDINMSNGSAIQFNDATTLTSNSVSGDPYLALQVRNVEGARLTPIGLGVGVTAPITRVDLDGGLLVRNGNITISTMGAAVTPQIGNLVADGDLYANGVFYPSDPALKTDVQFYDAKDLPTTVQFRWKATGQRDIGVLATDVERIEPACVSRSPNGVMNVDYAKLVVLCLSELRHLRAQVTIMRGEIEALRARNN